MTLDTNLQNVNHLVRLENAMITTKGLEFSPKTGQLVGQTLLIPRLEDGSLSTEAHALRGHHPLDIQLGEITKSESGGQAIEIKNFTPIIKHSSPTDQVGPDRWGKTANYYSPNVVLGRPLGVGIVGANGFIGEFTKESFPSSEFTLVSCALSRDTTKANQQRVKLGLRSDQVAATYQALIANKDIDLVVISTDNTSHFDIAKAALLAGKHVLCEKPVSVTLEEARELNQLAQEQKKVFVLNHFYTQYSQVSNLASIVQAPVTERTITINPNNFLPELNLGSQPFNIRLGKLQETSITYLQDWVLQELRKKVANAQGVELPADLGIWRLMEDRSGKSCCGGDIWTHGLEIITRIFGSNPTELLSKNLVYGIEGHTFPSDVEAQGTVKFANGAEANIFASQIRQGTLNDITVNLKFKGGALIWSNRSPNIITLYSQQIPGETKQIVLERGRPELENMSANASLQQRTVQGHDEGHVMAQTRLLKLIADRVTRSILEEYGFPVVGTPGYVPDGDFGEIEMSFVDKLVS
jgi:predicted dehydrogenase